MICNVLSAGHGDCLVGASACGRLRPQLTSLHVLVTAALHFDSGAFITFDPEGLNIGTKYHSIL